MISNILPFPQPNSIIFLFLKDPFLKSFSFDLSELSYFSDIDAAVITSL